MKKVLIIGLVFWQLFCFALKAQNADAILGKWMDENEETIIDIYQDGESFYGKIVWVKDSLDVFGSPIRDVLNDNTKLRSRKVLGTNTLKGFVWDGTDTWRKGEIYYYQTGNRYNGKITLSQEGTLKLKGYYSFLFFLGRTKTWTRMEGTSFQMKK